MNQEILNKKQLIDKYFKKAKNNILLDVFFYNVDGLSLYITLTYDKKTNAYKLFWINLSVMNTNKVCDWINVNLVYPSSVDKINSLLANNKDVKEYKDVDNIDSKIIINSYFKNYESKVKKFIINRYIPKELEFLADLLFTLFDSMPKYLFPMFQITIEKLIDPKPNILFAFDYNKDNIDKLFDKKVIESGKKYYKDNRVNFIERSEVDNYIYAVVRGTNYYLVSIFYNDDVKELLLNCNCDEQGFCKHMYAALEAYKNKDNKRFYKVAHVNEEGNILEIVQNFKYVFCADIFDDCFVLVSNNTFILHPIIENNKVSFKIIEDDEKKTLEKKLKKYLKSINYKE